MSASISLAKATEYPHFNAEEATETVLEIGLKLMFGTCTQEQYDFCRHMVNFGFYTYLQDTYASDFDNEAFGLVLESTNSADPDDYHTVEALFEEYSINFRSLLNEMK